jgi:hypothetical protein
LEAAVFLDKFPSNHKRQVFAQKRFAAVPIMSINNRVERNATIFVAHNLLYLPVEIRIMSVKPCLQVINNNKTIFVRFVTKITLTCAKRALDGQYWCPLFTRRLQLIAREKRIRHLYIPHYVADGARNLGYVITFGMNKFCDSGLPFLWVTIILNTALVVPYNKNFKISDSSSNNIQARQSQSLLKKNSSKFGLFLTRQLMPHKLEKEQHLQLKSGRKNTG